MELLDGLAVGQNADRSIELYRGDFMDMRLPRADRPAETRRTRTGRGE